MAKPEIRNQGDAISLQEKALELYSLLASLQGSVLDSGENMELKAGQLHVIGEVARHFGWTLELSPKKKHGAKK